MSALRLSDDLWTERRENARRERERVWKESALMRDIGEVRKDSEHTHIWYTHTHTSGWVSGRGNKRGSKSRPGPGVANERAPAGGPRGVRASYDVTRSVTSPPLPPTINDATLSSPSRTPRRRPVPPPRRRCRLRPTGLNQLVPVLKGAAAVSATWQPCLYLASTPPRTLAASRARLSLLRSTILLAWLILTSLLSSHSSRHSLYRFHSVRLATRAIPFARWYKQRDCASVGFSCRWFGQCLISIFDKGTPGTVPSWSSSRQYRIASPRCWLKLEIETTGLYEANY